GWRHEADLILILLARDLLTRHPGAKVVFDVKSSQALVDDIRQHGGVPVMWKTGHSHLKRKMRDDHILLGGEVSGHMFFAENYFVVDSGEVGVEKPNPRIFELALARAGVAAAEAAYIGDFYSIDVKGATAAGLRAVLLDPGGFWGARDCAMAPDLLSAVRLALSFK